VPENALGTRPHETCAAPSRSRTARPATSAVSRVVEPVAVDDQRHLGRRCSAPGHALDIRRAPPRRLGHRAAL